MHFIIFLIILFLIWLIFGQQIKRWLAGFMARRTEDYIRRATGMPPRPGSREARRQQKANENAQRSQSSGRSSAYDAGRRSSSSRTRKRKSSRSSGPLIPKEYAVDVEFVETINYSQTTIGVERDGRQETVYHESQVSDVEWEEIKVRKK